MELDDALRLLVEVESVSGDVGVLGSFIEVALHHLEEVGLHVSVGLARLSRAEAPTQGRCASGREAGEHHDLDITEIQYSPLL